jgi:hypothetical protein
MADAVYEDNFGYYDLEADPDEAAFFAFVKSQSKPRKCLRCSEPVKLQPGRKTCARCCHAMEYGAPPSESETRLPT